MMFMMANLGSKPKIKQRIITDEVIMICFLYLLNLFFKIIILAAATAGRTTTLVYCLQFC